MKERLDKINTIEDPKPIDQARITFIPEITVRQIQNMIIKSKNSILITAPKKRRIEDLIYMDGASDMCDIVIKNLELLVEKPVTPVTEEWKQIQKKQAEAMVLEERQQVERRSSK